MVDCKRFSKRCTNPQKSRICCEQVDTRFLCIAIDNELLLLCINTWRIVRTWILDSTVERMAFISFTNVLVLKMLDKFVLLDILKDSSVSTIAIKSNLTSNMTAHYSAGDYIISFGEGNQIIILLANNVFTPNFSFRSMIHEISCHSWFTFECPSGVRFVMVYNYGPHFFEEWELSIQLEKLIMISFFRNRLCDFVIDVWKHRHSFLIHSSDKLMIISLNSLSLIFILDLLGSR